MCPIQNLKVECLESTDTYGRFSAEPLERGTGTTVGNALRRVLLGSLSGAAINWVRIEGVEHEFSSVPHMKEDGLQFLLNLKTVRLRPLDNQPDRLTLEVRGDKAIYARDITPSAHFEIANPDLYLANLDSPQAKLFVELNVELGKGYVPAGSSKGLPLGTLPVDAIFTPVRRVNYAVEAVRMGEERAMERLVLEVWTDGTIAPALALSQGATILMEHFAIFRDVARLYPKEAVKPPLRLTMPQDQYNKPLEDMEFSSRTVNALKRGGITTLGQLLERSQEKLPSLRGLGEKSRQEIVDKLVSLGFSVASEQGEPEGEAPAGASAAETKAKSEA
ncbi:MAG: DNA-directed polymerase subunit alpha [Dehalococcoidia bacterium]|nr:DNA-directed polymerase subunit alpha [Dehalococcoidia bacterium]